MLPNREAMMHRFHIDSALVVAALVALTLPTLTQASPITFQRTYGGPADEICSQVVQTADGGFIMVGMTVSFGGGNDNCYVVKTDQRGDSLWTRVWGGPYLNGGNSISQATDGGYLIVADSGTSMDSGDVWLIRTDANGDMLWTRVYALGGGYLSLVEQTSDGGYVATGRTEPYGTNGDVRLLKTDASGDTLWTRTFGGAGDDDGKGIQQTTDGGYVIAGTTTSFGAGNQCIWLVKTDSIGDTLWTKTFGNEDSMAFGGSVQQTADGGYFVAGYKWPWSSDSASFYLVKTDSRGDTLWTRTIGGPGGWAEGMWGQPVKDGGYIVVGACATGLPDVYLVKTDANGDTLWTRTFGGPNFDVGYSVQQTADDGYVIAGQTYSFGAGASDFYLIKTDENGNLAVAEPKSVPPRKPGLSLSSEPNPFHSSTVFHMTTGALDHSATRLRIYDAQGRLVRTLAVGQARETMWNGRNDAGQLLPSGTYMVRVDAAGEHATTRLVLQR
jgi:hypothetical protein